MEDIHLQAAREQDVRDIVRIMEPYVAQRILLTRSPEDIRAHLGNFMVARMGETLVGCVALRDYGDGLQEIRSLVVAAEHTGRRIGSLLVQAALELAAKRHATTVFTLTLRPRFFQRMGFAIAAIADFPLKVQDDCLACPKRMACDETALKLTLTPTMDTPHA